MNRKPTLRTLLAIVLFAMSSRSASSAEVLVQVDGPLGVAAKRAVEDLQQTLQARDLRVNGEQGKLHDALPHLLIGLAGKSALVDETLAKHKLAVPNEAESLVVEKFGTPTSGCVIAGRDERGLVYALRDVERSVALAPKDGNVLDSIIDAVESPQLRVRTMAVHLFNADVEREWYFSEEFWRTYFRRLSLDRFNQLSLTFSDQCNYLCPVYPFLLALPEYPDVKAAGVGPAERERNLSMLRRISELADEHGIDFHLSLWMQAPVPRYSAPVTTSGLPEGLKLAEYSALALRRVLEACPSIRGVQLRMNEEAGVPAEQQTAFYRPMFQAIRAVESDPKHGRPIALHLRYKGLQKSTTQAALDEKLDVTVSTKFWSEHFGLPYHPTSVDSHWSEDRYSFGALLAKPRKYRVTYQLWTQGSNRLLLWGDPEYARRFAESCKLGGGEGFEVFAPLTDKGYGDRPGAWPVIKDAAYRVGRWEQDRYWNFSLLFGRYGYSAQVKPEVWQREFRYRFGPAASEIERAYRAASQVLPFITAVRLPGASEWSWWPEMDTGGGLREAVAMQTSDPRQFYAIGPWRKSPGWRWEDWDVIPSYVDDLLAGKLRGLWTPPQSAAHLKSLAAEIEQALAEARSLKHADSPEWKITQVDLYVLAELAKYHAEKLLAATEFAIAEKGRQPGRFWIARDHLSAASESWDRIARATENPYHHDLVFGVAVDSPRSKLGHHHTGHWKDRAAELAADIHALDTLISAQKDRGKHPLFGEGRPVVKLKVQHVPPKSLVAGQHVKLDMRILDGIKPWHVVVYHRSLDQTRGWEKVEMTEEFGGAYTAKISGSAIDPKFDWQYYFEAVDNTGGGRWPDWTERQPYFVVPVEVVGEEKPR